MKNNGFKVVDYKGAWFCLFSSIINCPIHNQPSTGYNYLYSPSCSQTTTLLSTLPLENRTTSSNNCHTPDSTRRDALPFPKQKVTSLPSTLPLSPIVSTFPRIWISQWSSSRKSKAENCAGHLWRRGAVRKEGSVEIGIARGENSREIGTLKCLLIFQN